MDCCLDIWGKDPEHASPYPLLAHLLDSAVTMGALWDRWLRPGLRQQIADQVAGGDSGRARAVLRLLAGGHDVGKANPLFALQEADWRDLAWRKGLRQKLHDAGLGPAPSSTVQLVQQMGLCAARRHEYVGMVGLLGGHPDPADRKLLRDSWAGIVTGGHHGSWRSAGGDADAATRLASGAWLAQQQQHLQAVEAAVGVRMDGLPHLDQGAAARTVVLLTGLVILADWLASDERVVGGGRALLDQGISLDGDWIAARAERLTAHVQQSVGSYIQPDDPTGMILGAREPRPLQREAVEQVAGEGGLWVVAYPTGEGKTETALLRHVARDDEGLLFALPTRATTDAMTTRLRDIFNGTGNEVVKSHQFAAAERGTSSGDGVSGPYSTDWFTTAIRRLVAPVSSMTCDQVLSGALRQRHAAVRLLALANHHVVIDEVHTFDHYQTELLIELLTWLGATGSRVTLLSATMPVWMQRRLAAAYAGGDAAAGEEIVPVAGYPSHRLVRGPGYAASASPATSRATVLGIEATGAGDRTSCHLAWVEEMAVGHPQCHIAVVVNTVAECQDLTKKVRAALPDEDVMCLHSRMAQGHRSAVERTLLDRTGPDETKHEGRVILVATQVVEASLDVDCDLMATDLAPSPSLLQRAGRLWRFAESSARERRHAASASPPERVLRVVAATQDSQITPKLALPYLASEMKRVWQDITGRSSITIPDDVQAFVDGTTVDLATFLTLMDTTSGDARHELDEMMKRHAAAQTSKASLATDLRAPRRPTYRSLITLTERSDPEEQMTTRFIERPGHSYLLIDPSAARGDIAWSCEHGVWWLLHAHASDVVQLLPSVVPVSGGRLDEYLLELHHQTLGQAGVSEWDPQSRMLNGLLPLDVRFLASLADYEKQTGLVRYDR